MSFREIRRKDRVLDDDSVQRLLETGEYGFLAMCAPEGYGYGIPLNFVREDGHIYFHCAPQGHKLDAITENDRVSFCVVGRTRVQPGEFTTGYESALVFGRARLVGDEEKLHALRLIVRKYSPEFVERAEKYIAGSFGRTAVVRLDIEHLSGKSKRIKE